MESIQGHYYELETPDLLAGVDWVIGQGLADPDRLASIGWSNGGILTADLITRTDRFKAASVGAADVEWISDWANVAFGASFDNYYFGGPPWEATETYLEKSPFFRLTEVTTPTIIYTGTEDTNVPPHQSWSLFRALQQIDKAPARLVLFPGEPHGLRKISDQRRKMREDLDWLDRYVFAPEAQKEPEAIRPGTLLAGLMERAGAAAAASGAAGVEEDGVLVPETVTFAGQTVGRFEVTRAQWAAFDPDAELAPGAENLPVTGISFERAKAYAAWLAERTGRGFRLPTVKEAEALAKAALWPGRAATRSTTGPATRPTRTTRRRSARRSKRSSERRRARRRCCCRWGACRGRRRPTTRRRCSTWTATRPNGLWLKMGAARRSGRARTGRRMRGGTGGSRRRSTSGCGWSWEAGRASRGVCRERREGGARGDGGRTGRLGGNLCLVGVLVGPDRMLNRSRGRGRQRP